MQRAYYERNAEERRALARRIRNRDVEGARVRAKQWREANPGKVNAASARRRLIVAQAEPLWADQFKINAAYAVARFLSEMWGEPHEVDHIVPLRGRSVCGLHVHNNLRVVHWTENRSKSNRHADA